MMINGAWHLAQGQGDNRERQVGRTEMCVLAENCNIVQHAGVQRARPSDALSKGKVGNLDFHAEYSDFQCLPPDF